jgi:hypothetical protein
VWCVFNFFKVSLTSVNFLNKSFMNSSWSFIKNTVSDLLKKSIIENLKLEFLVRIFFNHGHNACVRLALYQVLPHSQQKQILKFLLSHCHSQQMIMRMMANSSWKSVPIKSKATRTPFSKWNEKSCPHFFHHPLVGMHTAKHIHSHNHIP